MTTIATKLFWSSIFLVLILVVLQFMHSKEAACQTNYATAFSASIRQSFVEGATTDVLASRFIAYLQEFSTMEKQALSTSHMYVDEGDLVYLDTKDRALGLRGLSVSVRHSARFGSEIKLKHFSPLSACDSETVAGVNTFFLVPGWVSKTTLYPLYTNDFTQWLPSKEEYFASSLALSSQSNFSRPVTTFSDLCGYFPGLLQIPVRPSEPLIPIRNTALRETVIGNITVSHRPFERSEIRLTVVRSQNHSRFVHASLRVRTVPQNVVVRGTTSEGILATHNMGLVTPDGTASTQNFFHKFLLLNDTKV
eukprot:PhF_6_TR43602/c0_g1_i1/m.66967